MSDVYDWRGRLVEWEPDDVPGPTVEQLNAVIDSLNAQLTRLLDDLQRECAVHDQVLTRVEEENARLAGELAQSQADLHRVKQERAGLQEQRDTLTVRGLETRAELARVKTAARDFLEAVHDQHNTMLPWLEVVARYNEAKARLEQATRSREDV